jgi:hypothetical protein
MLLEFCERCFAGTAPLVDPEWRWPSAPKVWRGDLRRRRCEGAKRRDASGGPWLRRDGAMTRGHSKRVKGRRTKQIQGAQRVKGVWPCEDTLEACTTRGLTVMPL